MFPERASTTARVAEEIRAILGRRKISKNSLDGLGGNSREYWRKRIMGEFSPSLEDLDLLADLLDVDVLAFYGVNAGTPRPDGPGGSTSRLRESNSRPFHYE